MNAVYFSDVNKTRDVGHKHLEFTVSLSYKLKKKNVTASITYYNNTQ